MSETTEQPNTTAHTQAVPLDTQDLPALHPSKASGTAMGLDHLLDVTVPVTVDLGHARMSIAGLAQLAPGSLITLDREAHEPVDILVGGKLVARGEVVTVGSRYGVRITSMCG
jgi:flagellar motor switch protein FliN/FliY